MPSAIVLVVDGLGAKHVGPYGNTWIETAAFNRLASQSLLIQQMYAQPTLRVAYQDFWPSRSPDGESLISWLAERGVSTKLFTDEAAVTDAHAAAAFREQTEMDAPDGLKLASSLEDTHAADFFAQAMALLEGHEDNSLLWLHTRGLGNPWDAPFAFRAQFADEDDPDPSTSAQVPSLELEPGFDPDALHEIRCALAGQVTLLDHCLDVVLSVVEEIASKTNALLVVTSARGFPLGEHQVVGWRGAGLYHELLHVPAFLRFPDQMLAMQRWAGLSECGDLEGYLREWFSGNSFVAAQRQVSLQRHGHETLLRTPVWHHRLGGLDGTLDELYLKPDDQQEVNDVADRCEDVVSACRMLEQAWDCRPATDVPEVLLDPPD